VATVTRLVARTNFYPAEKTHLNKLLPTTKSQPAQRSFRNRTKHFRQFLPLTTGSPKRDFRLPGSQKFIPRDKSSPPMSQVAANSATGQFPSKCTRKSRRIHKSIA